MSLDNRKKSEQWTRNKATEYVALDTDLTFTEWCYQQGKIDERKKVLDEVREITKTIEADDIVARAESCGKNCRKCDGCLTRILFEQMKGAEE